MIERRPPSKKAFTGLVGRPPEQEPEPERRGRPPKFGVAMTPAQRKKKQRTVAEIDALIREQAVDRHTGGAFGPGRYMNQADRGKGELVTGGYNSTMLDAVFAKQHPGFDGENEFALANRPPGASPDFDTPESAPKPIGKYSANFNHEWNQQQKEREWERILALLIFDTTVCSLCDWSSLTATEEEICQHLQTHRGLRHLDCGPVILNEPRCIVCGQPGTDHIRACELTTEDRNYNRDCTLGIFKQAGIQPRKMTETDKAHRRATKAARDTLHGVS